MVAHGSVEKVAEEAVVEQMMEAASDTVVVAELVPLGCGSTEHGEPGSWIVHRSLVECEGVVATKLGASFGRVPFLFYFQKESPGKRTNWRPASEPCILPEQEVVEQEVAGEGEGC